MKKSLKMLCAALALTFLPLSANAYDIFVDGEKIVALDVNGSEIEAFMENGTTYVPVRAVASAFDTEVSWDQATLTVFLGDKSGSPKLNDYINIFYNGEEFTARDAAGNIVRPILRYGVTYLPIRALGELFEKKVAWDAVSQSVIISSRCGGEALDYFKKAVADSEGRGDVSAQIKITSSLSKDGAAIGFNETVGYEPFSAAGFSLSSFLPENYDEYVSYLGEGRFFLSLPPDKFAASEFVTKALTPFSSEFVFSSLSVLVSTKGGYMTDIEISVCANFSMDSTAFRTDLSISSQMVYPQTFAFPIIPFPANIVYSQQSALSDASETEGIVKSYFDALFSAKSADMEKLLHLEDSYALFGIKSDSQKALELTIVSKKLTNLYEFSDGTYSVDSLDYVEPTLFSDKAEKAIKVTASTTIKNGDDSTAEDVTFVIVKIDEKWYLSKTSFEELMK